MLKGYKTYVVAAIAAITALGTFLVGEMSLAEMLQTIFTAGIGAFLRAGVAKQ